MKSACHKSKDFADLEQYLRQQIKIETKQSYQRFVECVEGNIKV